MRKAILVAVLVLGLAGLGVSCNWWTFGGPTAISVSVYFTYPGTTKPEDDNPEREAIIPLINGLNSGDTLDIAMYSLTDDDIKAAILDAHDRGVEVRIYLEGENACGRGADAADYLAAGIPVRVDNRSGLMHHKFAVLDYADAEKTDTSITGSYNWSASADERNWENVVVIHSATIAADYEANFEDMWENWSEDFQGCG